ncbi:hypothetical protein LguiB_018028 [Lonicera macranthoides]
MILIRRDATVLNRCYSMVFAHEQTQKWLCMGILWEIYSFDQETQIQFLLLKLNYKFAFHCYFGFLKLTQARRVFILKFTGNFAIFAKNFGISNNSDITLDLNSQISLPYHRFSISGGAWFTSLEAFDVLKPFSPPREGLYLGHPSIGRNTVLIEGVVLNGCKRARSHWPSVIIERRGNQGGSSICSHYRNYRPRREVSCLIRAAQRKHSGTSDLGVSGQHVSICLGNRFSISGGAWFTSLEASDVLKPFSPPREGLYCIIDFDHVVIFNMERAHIYAQHRIRLETKRLMDEFINYKLFEEGSPIEKHALQIIEVLSNALEERSYIPPVSSPSFRPIMPPWEAKNTGVPSTLGGPRRQPGPTLIEKSDSSFMSAYIFIHIMKSESRSSTCLETVWKIT